MFSIIRDSGFWCSKLFVQVLGGYMVIVYLDP